MPAATQKQIASLKIEEIVPDEEPVIFPAAKTKKLPSLWAAAFERLTTKEKSSIKSIVAKIGDPVEHIVGEIRDEVKKQGDLHQGKKWTIQFCGKKIVLQEVMQRIMTWLDRFKDLGDVISSYDPIHLALPWAGIRFLIQATVAHGKLIGELLVGLETAMYLINRFQIYEILYLSIDQPKSKAKDNLTSAVVATYTSILRFLAAANKTYSDNPALRTVRAIFSPDQVSGLLSECQKWAAEANIDADNCERSSNQSAREDLIRVRRMLQGLEDFKSKLNAMWEESRSGERVRILQWISAIPYEDMHDQSKVGRMDGTGLWLLEEKKFRLWRDTQSPMTLWLHGPPGQGKTKLISLAVDSLLAKLNNDQALAYFYCNRKQSDRQTPESIMRSCLRQLATSRNNEDVVHTALGNLYRRAESKAFASNNLSLDTMKQEFINIADTFSTVFIVVDAFDECELKSRANLIESFREIAEETATPVKILISTRPADDINYYMNSEPNIELTSIHNRHDITRFVKKSIDVQPKDSPNLRFWREQITDGLKQEICQVLIEKSDGMFLWVKLQIAQLRELKSESQIRKRLGRLPKELHTLYDEIWEQIQEDENENMAIIAERAIQILSCAFQPLSPDKLLVAVCQDPETDTVQEDINIDIDYVLDACRSLLIVDHHEKICRLSHLSVYEYFEARGWSESPPHAFMAEVCLKLVIHTASADFCMLSEPGHGMSGISEFKIYNCASLYGNTATKKESDLRIFSLVPYAYYHWPLHARACDKEKGSYSYERLANRVRNFFGPMNEGSVAYDRWKLVCSHWKYTTGRYELYWGFRPQGPPVNVMTFFGFDSILPYWWESGFSDVNSDDYGELLKLAIQGGSLPKVKWLLESGVVCDGEAVMYAVECNYLAITKSLLEHGVDSDMSRLFRVPALRGNTDMVQLLVDFGADIRRSGALASVADKFSPHQERMLSFLLKLGADPSIDFDFLPWCAGGALAIAVHRGNERVTKLILESAPFLARAKNDKSLLPVAVFVQNARIVEMLLDHGADLDTPGGSWQYYDFNYTSNMPEIFKVWGKRKDLISYDTPLTEAIKTLNPEITRLLLCRGANLDNPDRRLISVFEIVRNNFRTHNISGTKEGGDEKNAQLMVKLLLDYGADTNAVEAKHGSVLAAAASIGSLGVVELLVHQGADVNAQGGEQNISPLIAAVEGSRECREERFYVFIIQFLLEQGAHVNARGGEYGSALAAATHWIYDIDYSRVRGGYTEHIYGYTIETPLNAGDLASEELRGALYLKRGKVIVEMLRKHGAQVIDTVAREKAYSERWKS